MSTEPASTDTPNPNHPDTPAPTVWTCQICEDATACLDWYVRVLGFVETARYEESGHIAHAELRWPEGGGLMLGDLRSPDDPFAAPPGSARPYVVTADSRALYERAVAAGADVEVDLNETDYGDVSFALRDPDGNVVSVGMYRGAPMPSE